MSSDALHTAPAIPYEQSDESSGLLAWVSTVDHKKIGILYLLTALMYFCVAGIEATLMRIQLMYPRNDFLSPRDF